MNTIKIKDYHKRLVEGVTQVLESESFKEFLQFSAKFKRYSFGNTLLIWSQRPQASRLAGMKAWNLMGRHVKKGEKGIAIFAPLMKKVKGYGAEADAVVKAETENKGERLVGFRAVYVWDIEQTDGKPVPELKTEAPVMDGNPEMLFVRILQASPVSVEYKDIKGSARGYYMPKEKRIILSIALKAEERCKTLLHELAHHLSYSEISEGFLSGLDRPAEEVIAEGAAFMASAHFGLDSSGYSFPYVASWSQDAEKVLSAGNVMRKVALQLIEIVENVNETSLDVAVPDYPW
jgi:antirestriction protein ArdC